MGRCFACVKRRSECHYSHLADLIELLTQSLTPKNPSSDGVLGNHIVPWASIRQKKSQNQAVMLRQILPLSTSVSLDFGLRLHIGTGTDSSTHTEWHHQPHRTATFKVVNWILADATLQRSLLPSYSFQYLQGRTSLQVNFVILVLQSYH